MISLTPTDEQVVICSTVAATDSGKKRKKWARRFFVFHFRELGPVHTPRTRWRRRGAPVRVAVLERACIMITDILVSLNIIAALLLLAQLLH